MLSKSVSSQIFKALFRFEKKIEDDICYIG